MTINSIRSYYQSQVLNSPAAIGFNRSLQDSASGASSQTAVQPSGDGDRGPSRAMQAAMAKLQQIDPQLAEKLDSFRQEAQSMLDGGSSKSDVFQTLKSDLSQLSDQETSELKSVMHPHHRMHQMNLQSATDPTSILPDDSTAQASDPAPALMVCPPYNPDPTASNPELSGGCPSPI